MTKRLSLAHGLAILGSLIAVGFFFFPVGGLDLQTSRIAALTLFLIVFWATNVLPPYLTVLIYFALVVLFQVIPTELVFSGFASGAFWLVFGGLVIGAAVKETGLATRVADWIAGTFGGSYRGLIAGLIVLGMLLSFIMPSSMGRVVLLVPIALALADRYQFAWNAPGRYGILLATIFGTHLTSFGIMPANVPNVILIGTMETVWDVSISYGSYLALHYPILGIAKALIVFALILLSFPDTLPENVEVRQRQQQPMSSAEVRLSIIMAGVLLMWGLDFWHGISASWVALVAAVLLLLPGIGVLSTDIFNKGISYSSLFFVAGLIAMGTMIAQSDLSALFGDFIEATLPLSPGADFQNFMVLSLTAAVSSVIGTVPTVPAVLVPLADMLATMSGLPLLTVLMTHVIGFSTVLFPYQAAPLLVGVMLAELPAGKVLRFTLTIALITVVFLLPLDYLWFRLLGFFG